VAAACTAFLAFTGAVLHALLHSTNPLPDSSAGSQGDHRRNNSGFGSSFTETVDVHVAVAGVRKVVSPEEEEDMVRDLLGGISGEDESSASELDDSRLSAASGARPPREFAAIQEEPVAAAAKEQLEPDKAAAKEAKEPDMAAVAAETAVEAFQSESEVRVSGVDVAVAPNAGADADKAETAAMRKSAPLCGAFRCFRFGRSRVARKSSKHGVVPASADKPAAEVGINGAPLPKVEYEEVELHTVHEDSEAELGSSGHSSNTVSPTEDLDTPPEGTGVAAFMAAAGRT